MLFFTFLFGGLLLSSLHFLESFFTERVGTLLMLLGWSSRKELVVLFNKIDAGVLKEGPELSDAITTLHRSR
jgi:hypothetical protein